MSRHHSSVYVTLTVLFTALSVLFLTNCAPMGSEYYSDNYGDQCGANAHCYKSEAKYNKSSGTYRNTWMLYTDCSSTCLETIYLRIQAPYGSTIVGAYLWGTSESAYSGGNIECYMDLASPTSILEKSCYVRGTSYQYLEIEYTGAEPYIDGWYSTCGW